MLTQTCHKILRRRLTGFGNEQHFLRAATLRQAASLQQVKRVRVSPMIAPGPVALVYRAQGHNARVDLLREALGLGAMDNDTSQTF